MKITADAYTLFDGNSKCNSCLKAMMTLTKIFESTVNLSQIRLQKHPYVTSLGGNFCQLIFSTKNVQNLKSSQRSSQIPFVFALFHSLLTELYI